MLSQDSGIKAHLRQSVHRHWELTGDSHRTLFLEMAGVIFHHFFPSVAVDHLGPFKCPLGPFCQLGHLRPLRKRGAGSPAAGEEKSRVRPGAEAPARGAQARSPRLELRAQGRELSVGSLERFSRGGGKHWVLNGVKASFNFSIL